MIAILVWLLQVITGGLIGGFLFVLWLTIMRKLG